MQFFICSVNLHVIFCDKYIQIYFCFIVTKSLISEWNLFLCNVHNIVGNIVLWNTFRKIYTQFSNTYLCRVFPSTLCVAFFSNFKCAVSTFYNIYLTRSWHCRDCYTDKLKHSAPSRIVNVSSVAHKMFGPLDLANLNSEKAVRKQSLYSHSKLAQILFTRELSKRLDGSGLLFVISVNFLTSIFFVTVLSFTV